MGAGNQNYVVRSASSVDEARDLWWPLMKQLGWNRDFDDGDTHFKAARVGKDWHLIIPEETGKPEGCVVGFTYPNGTGWVGYFILNAPFRGKGLGRELWKEMENAFRASNTTVIGLDGVKEQVNTYARRGFVEGAQIPLMVRKSLKEEPFSGSLKLSTNSTGDMSNIRSADPQVLARLDLEHTGLDRSAYWAQDALLSRQDARGYTISRDSKVVGAILIRRCEHGHRVGPLYAETTEQARKLLYAAMDDLKESEGSLIAEIFGDNSEGKGLFEEFGWTWAGINYHRMWLNGVVPQEQQEGGKGSKGMFAIFDACAG